MVDLESGTHTRTARCPPRSAQLNGCPCHVYSLSKGNRAALAAWGGESEATRVCAAQGVPSCRAPFATTRVMGVCVLPRAKRGNGEGPSQKGQRRMGSPLHGNRACCFSPTLRCRGCPPGLHCFIARVLQYRNLCAAWHDDGRRQAWVHALSVCGCRGGVLLWNPAPCLTHGPGGVMRDSLLLARHQRGRSWGEGSCVCNNTTRGCGMPEGSWIRVLSHGAVTAGP